MAYYHETFTFMGRDKKTYRATYFPDDFAVSWLIEVSYFARIYDAGESNILWNVDKEIFRKGGVQ